MKGFDTEFLQQLKSKIDIVDVISSYVSLEKKGMNYWACCPFHHEKTPSFSVNSVDQYYHCFGCGASGDAITFVRKMETVDFMDAVKILAERAKIPLPDLNFDSEKTIEQKRKRDAILKILRASARFYLNNLNSGHADAHIDYILSRKLSSSTVRKFGLGASLDFKTLPQYLLDQGFRREDILDSGAVVESDRHAGRLIDAQGGRLIFPIINALDDVVAFGGRVLEKTDFAKYKNTRETSVFNKSKNLYNINLLKKQKKATGLKNIIMVEGYMDTISLYQAGFTNVVASMGTALTKEQARLAKRYADEILISYDGDFAGQKGAIRGLEILRDEGASVRVVSLPEGLDPDDVVKKYGNDGYRKCLDSAMPLTDFKLEVAGRGYDLSKTEERRAYIAEALRIIREEESVSVREDLLKTLRDKTGVTYESLKRDLDNLPAETPPAQDREPVRREDGADRNVKACRFILASVLFGAKYAKNFDLSSVRFDNPVHNTIADYIADRRKREEKVRASDLFEIFDEKTPELSEILDLSLGDNLEGERAARYFSDCVKTLGRQKIEEELKKLSAECDAQTDLAEKKRITRRILELTIQLKNF
ncbi:MAG TPA: DNA primase [Candidatus Borkfalkia excrementavium]|uniref:DNA primase n=1 Tax=Candidatus Borkfalkia excrementavium TaxID=2838505 RepID=A0A9D1Z7V1_9FIRM|nr:DNA primase [Candidatus Borkfalkia excrementavium]